jgi:hypothetical protein
MSSVIFGSYHSVQRTITTITSTPLVLQVNLCAYNTNLSSLSTYSTLAINSFTTTSSTMFNILNLLSTNSTLSINNSSATTTTTILIFKFHYQLIQYHQLINLILHQHQYLIT